MQLHVLRNRTHENEALKNVQFPEIFSNYLFTDIKKKKKKGALFALLQKMHYEVAQRL